MAYTSYVLCNYVRDFKLQCRLFRVLTETFYTNANLTVHVTDVYDLDHIKF